MLKLVLAGAIAVPVVTTATVAATGVMWVDVREGGAGGQRIVVPVPLLLAEAAAAFVPKQHTHLKMGEAGRQLAAARGVLQALADSPDAELVRVEEPGEQVVVSKVGDMLHVQVHDRGGEDVSVNLPVSAIRDLIEEDGTIDPAAAVRALRSSRFTTLVEVRDGDEHVKVTVW